MGAGYSVFKSQPSSKYAEVSRERQADCVFCNIAGGSSDRLLYQTERVAVFEDIRPAAKRHLLIIPRTHIANTASLTQDDLDLVFEMHEVGRKLLAEQHPGDQHKLGYHVPPWTSVNHLHLHAFALPHSPPWKVLKYVFPCIWLPANQLECQLGGGAPNPVDSRV